MNEPNNTQAELIGRLDVIESMLQEGRRTTEYWGWVFVLWGAAYIVAIGLSYAPVTAPFAWPVTMVVAGILTAVLARKKARAKRYQTPLGRSIGGIWAGIGISIFVFCFAAAFSGHVEPHSYDAAVLIFVAAANCASSIALRWRLQFLVALLWWISAVVVLIAPASWIVFIVLIDALAGFLGFGLYLMYCERRDRRRKTLAEGDMRTSHA